MAHTISLTDGTTTVQLNSGNAVLEYPFYAPNGDEIRLGEVTETLNLLIIGGNLTTIQAIARSIETLLESARRRRLTGTGPRVYIQVQLSGDGTTKRSEVLDGRLTGENYIAQLWRGKIEESLLITRRAWWESTTEAEASISANGQGAATGGRTITNDGVNNWIGFDGAQLSGVLPTPVRLRFTNTSGATQTFDTLWAGNNAFASPASFGYVLQGESRITGYGTVNSGSGYSGGQYVTLANVGTPETLKIAWHLTAAMMVAGGRWFRLLMRTDYPAYDTYVRPAIYDYNGAVMLWSGNKVRLPAAPSAQLHDLGAIPVPPGAYDSSYAQVRLALHLQAPTSYSMNVDYVELLGTDALRIYRCVGLSVANNDYLEMDDIEGKAYAVSAGAKTPGVSTFGAPLMVFPGVTQRILVGWRQTSGASTVTHTASVRFWYRPRWLTI